LQCDEAGAFTGGTAELRNEERRRALHLDWLAGIATFKAVLLEASKSYSSSSPSAPAAACSFR
jgi:hypothetical protein